jgi:hypothetical protein
MAIQQAAYDPQFGFFPQSGLIGDPGDGKYITVIESGTCPIVTTAGETRKLAIPTRGGIEITLFFQTDGGAVVITSDTAINGNADTIITMADALDSITLRSVYTGTAWAWRVAWNDINGADDGASSDIGLGLSH